MQERVAAAETSSELAAEVQSLRQKVADLQRQLDSASRVVSLPDRVQSSPVNESSLDEPLEHLITATTRVSGTDFFEALVQHLTTALGVSAAWVGRLSDPNKNWVTELACYNQGNPDCPKSYQLRDTPCHSVATNGEYFQNSDLCETFPEDSALRDFGAVGYFGVRFDDSSGKPLGLLCVMDTEELADSKRLRNIVRMFAQRAAFELERKINEDSLALFRSQIDEANDALEVVDPATGRFLDVNQRACTMHGFSREEYLQLSVAEIDPLVSVEHWQSIRRELETTGFYSTDSFHSRKDGSSFPVEIHSSYVVLERPYVVAIVRDISERLQSQQALKDSEARLRALIDLIPDLIFRLNSSGEYVDAKNNPAEDLLLPPDEYLGKHYREILPEHVAEQLDVAILIAHSESRVVTLSYELELPSGGTRHSEARLVAAEDGGCVVVVRDISDQVKAERQLAESGAQLRMAIAATQIGVWDWDMATDRVHLSESWYRQLGLQPRGEEDHFSNWESRLHPDDAPYVLEQLQRYIEGAQKDYAVEFRLRHADGSYRWIYSRGVVMRSSDGTPTTMLGCHVDVTERKTSEQRISDLERDLAHVWRVNAMGEMVTALAHELNQPLTAIANYAGVCAGALSQLNDVPSELTDVVSRIESQSLRAGTIVNRMKRFVAKTSPRLTRQSINEVIEDVAELLSNQVRLQNASIELTLEESIPEVLIDAIQIQQVLVNFVTNAIEASVDSAPDNRIVYISSSLDGNAVRVDVRDRGHGLDHSQIESFFEPFKSTKSGGLGMGLKISRRIVHAHGGKIFAKPNPEGGTTFSFLIPAVDSEAASSTATNIAESDSSQSPK